MFESTAINSVLAVVLTVLVCFVISTLLPGIERKYIHARIQQRIGPIVIAPGIMAPLKFMFKENVEISSPVPGSNVEITKQTITVRITAMTEFIAVLSNMIYLLIISIALSVQVKQGSHCTIHN